MRGNLLRSGDFPSIVVPAPHLSLCSKNVLVMEEVENAVKLTSALTEDMSHFARERGMSTAALLAEERALNAAALARGELRSGPDGASMCRFISARRWRNALAPRALFARVHVPLNHGALLDELLRVHGHEALIDGALNGDPHPGNVLVVREGARAGGEPRLALVDYGQVKLISPEDRLRLARLVVALADADAAAPAHVATVARLIHDMGLTTRRNDPDTLFRLARVYFDRDDLIATEGLHVQAYIEKLQAADPLVSAPQSFVLVARASIMLRGLGHMLNQHRSGAQAWRPLAVRVLRENGEDPAKVLA